MLTRNHLRGGAIVGATALLALVHAWRSPASAPTTVEHAQTETSANGAVPPASAIATPRIAAEEPETQPSAGATAPRASVGPEARRAKRAARAHLRSVASRFELETRDIDALEHRDTYVGDRGARIVRFRQLVDGRPIIGREVNVVLTSGDEPVGVTGRLASSTALRRAEIGTGRATRSARDAVTAIVGSSLRSISGEGDDESFAFANDTRARVRRVSFDRDGELVPAHQVELHPGSSRDGEASVVIVSAVDGTRLQARSLAHADATFRVFADSWSGPYDSPAGTSPTPHPTGLADGYTPSMVSPQVVTLANYPFSRNDPWLPPSASSLSGNAVFAYVDRAAPSGFDPVLDLDVPPTAPGVFDYVYDPNISPTASDGQRRAAAAQLFYVTSYLHDVFYDTGFDESAGNAQASNFGRGGFEDDRLVVAAQAQGLDNRSLAVIPPDGSTPRLSFGIYKGQGGRPDRDGALDTTLVAHEWGHLLAERLVGNAVGLGNGQGRAISEGTADFVALLVTIRPEDVNVPGNNQFQGVYAVGGYAASAISADAHYYGLRRAPYSTDATRNALSFEHIAAGAKLPTTAPMRSSAPADNALPHNAGEVWGTALLECYASLLRAHPFEEARDRMRRYLVAGLRATPFEPTFGEAAQALRLAATASDPADGERFIAAFAKRGLGLDARSPTRASTDLVGASPGFATNQALRVVEITLDDSITTCDGDGVLDLGENGRLRVTFENVGRSTVSGWEGVVSTQGSSTGVDFPGGNHLTIPWLAPGARGTSSLPIHLANASSAFADIRITFTETILPSKTLSLRTPVHADESVSSTTDTMSTRKSTLAFERNGIRAPFVASRDAIDDFAHVDDGPSRGTNALVTGPLTVTSQLGVSFRARHSLVRGESSAPVDGAVVEISEDGIHFEDVTKSGASPGYEGALAAGTTNPLGARAAYTGMSAGFPAFATRTLNLGNAYIGKTVMLRFRVGASGGNASAYGLDIDDLSVTGVAGTPFFGRVPETSDGAVCNRPPVADAGDDVSVTQFSGDPALGVPTVVSLSAANSFDPDGSPLTFAWSQLSGPAVTLASTTGPTTTFPVPGIAADTVFVFRVTTSDGIESSSDTVRITVRRDNRAPSAVANGPSSVTSGASVVLDGSQSSDPDGDALTYTWKQTSGPAVTFLTNNVTATFMAPLVTASTKLGFTLEVADGIATSSPVAVDVTVNAASSPDAGGPSSNDDAGTTPGVDGGFAGTDGGGGGTGAPDTNDDGEDESVTADDGGGCAAAGARGTTGAAAWVVAGVLGLVMRRRRRNSAR